MMADDVIFLDGFVCSPVNLPGLIAAKDAAVVWRWLDCNLVADDGDDAVQAMAFVTWLKNQIRHESVGWSADEIGNRCLAVFHAMSDYYDDGGIFKGAEVFLKGSEDFYHRDTEAQRSE